MVKIIFLHCNGIKALEISRMRPWRGHWNHVLSDGMYSQFHTAGTDYQSEIILNHERITTVTTQWQTLLGFILPCWKIGSISHKKMDENVQMRVEKSTPHRLTPKYFKIDNINSHISQIFKVESNEMHSQPRLLRQHLVWSHWFISYRKKPCFHFLATPSGTVHSTNRTPSK